MIKNLGKRIKYQATAALRAVPTFMIIGAQKAGTTSLYQYLLATGQVAMSEPKEPFYFSHQYHHPPYWYKRLFPYKWRAAGQQIGEGSTHYLYYPQTPQRIKNDLPHTKFIVLLRDPVERAWSHYNLTRRFDSDTGSFEAELACEDQRFAMLHDDDHYFTYWHMALYAYRHFGEYATHLQRWFTHFPREQFLIIHSADFFTCTAETMQYICEFIGITTPPAETYPVYGSEKRTTSMNPATRAKLEEHFRPHNAALYELLGVNYGW